MIDDFPRRLLTGAKSTKGLHVCRHLHRAGWRVVLVDVHKYVFYHHAHRCAWLHACVFATLGKNPRLIKRVRVIRNWAAGARWSGCVAAFRTYPVPNKDPIGYLKVDSSSCIRVGLCSRAEHSNVKAAHCWVYNAWPRGT